MPERVKQEPQGITRKEINAKYRTHQVRFYRAGIGKKDPKEVSRNSGRRRKYLRGKWYDIDNAPPERPRDRADWGRHLKKHELLLKQVMMGEDHR